MNLYTHMNFGGNCEEAFRYYAKHLGGTIVMIMRQDEEPGNAAKASKAVIHARLAVGHTVLIGNDVPADTFKPIRSCYLYLSLPSSEEAERVYNGLAAGGQVFAPLVETFYATRFGQLRDRFGVLWTILHEKPQP